MRSSILSVFALAVAAPLSAGWWPVWNPSSVYLVVGQATTVQVRAHWSGLADYAGGIHWTFRSDDEYVATALVHVNEPGPHDVRIVAVNPGTAFIRQEAPNWGLVEPAWVRINVVCGAEAPVRAAVPVLRGTPRRAGQGRRDFGDRRPHPLHLVPRPRRRPLASAGRTRPADRLHPERLRTHYVWASAVTPCSTSTAEFRIDVARPRGRAARR